MVDFNGFDRITTDEFKNCKAIYNAVETGINKSAVETEFELKSVTAKKELIVRMADCLRNLEDAEFKNRYRAITQFVFLDYPVNDERVKDQVEEYVKLCQYFISVRAHFTDTKSNLFNTYFFVGNYLAILKQKSVFDEESLREIRRGVFLQIAYELIRQNPEKDIAANVRTQFKGFQEKVGKDLGMMEMFPDFCDANEGNFLTVWKASQRPLRYGEGTHKDSLYDSDGLNNRHSTSIWEDEYYTRSRENDRRKNSWESRRNYDSGADRYDRDKVYGNDRQKERNQTQNRGKSFENEYEEFIESVNVSYPSGNVKSKKMKFPEKFFLIALICLMIPTCAFGAFFVAGRMQGGHKNEKNIAAETTIAAAAETSLAVLAESTQAEESDESLDIFGEVGKETAEASSTAETKESAAGGSVQEIIDNMTLEEKVCQMFMISPEELVSHCVDTVVRAGDTTKNALTKYPVGGVDFTKANFQDPDQTKNMLSTFQEYYQELTGFPILLACDEEGGTVLRVACNAAFNLKLVGNMCDVKSADEAYDDGEYIGSYLSDLGINLDLAPVSDVITNKENTVVIKRSFGDDPDVVSEDSKAFLDGLHSHNVLGCLKHFPGHGGTSADSHEGEAVSNRTLEEIEESELVPFQDGISYGCRIIMVSHVEYPEITEEDVPASLSKELMTDLLRNKMGFDGVIMTDSMSMQAITDNYSSAEAAVKSIQAGADMILAPESFQEAYKGVLDAVKKGEITEERIDQSVERILKVKQSLKTEEEKTSESKVSADR